MLALPHLQRSETNKRKGGCLSSNLPTLELTHHDTLKYIHEREKVSSEKKAKQKDKETFLKVSWAGKLKIERAARNKAKKMAKINFAPPKPRKYAKKRGSIDNPKL
jgi:hypothetical protein